MSMGHSRKRQRTHTRSGRRHKALFPVLVMSMLTTILSIAVLCGATYAWFTGYAISGGSGIDAGTFNIHIYKTDRDNLTLREEITEAVPVFNLDEDMRPGEDMTAYLAVVNEGEAFSEYGITFTVDKINEGNIPEEDTEGTYSYLSGGYEPIINDLEGAEAPAGEADIAEIIEVYFARVKKKAGSEDEYETGPYIYIGRLSELTDAYTDFMEVIETEGDGADEAGTDPAEEIDYEAEEAEINEKLDALDNSYIRGLLLTKDEMENKGFDGPHTYIYDPDKAAGSEYANDPFSIERLRQTLLPHEEEDAKGEYEQLISVKLRIPDKVYAVYQNCSLKIGIKLISTQRARELSTVTAYASADDEGKPMGIVTGGGIYHRYATDEERAITELQQTELTATANEGYKFSKWRYGITGAPESEMIESEEEIQTVIMDKDYTYIAEFVRDKEPEEIDVPGDDWED